MAQERKERSAARAWAGLLDPALHTSLRAQHDMLIELTEFSAEDIMTVLADEGEQNEEAEHEASPVP